MIQGWEDYEVVLKFLEGTQRKSGNFEQKEARSLRLFGDGENEEDSEIEEENGG